MESQIIKKLEAHDEQLETIARNVVNLQGQMADVQGKVGNLQGQVTDVRWEINEMKETMATKKDIADMNDTLDELVGLARKKDQELTFMGERMGRLEDDFEQIKLLPH